MHNEMINCEKKHYEKNTKSKYKKIIITKNTSTITYIKENTRKTHTD